MSLSSRNRYQGGIHSMPSSMFRSKARPYNVRIRGNDTDPSEFCSSAVMNTCTVCDRVWESPSLVRKCLFLTFVPSGRCHVGCCRGCAVMLVIIMIFIFVGSAGAAPAAAVVLPPRCNTAPRTPEAARLCAGSPLWRRRLRETALLLLPAALPPSLPRPTVVPAPLLRVRALQKAAPLQP